LNGTWCKTTIRVFYTKNGSNLALFELIETAKKAAQGNRSWNTYYLLFARILIQTFQIRFRLILRNSGQFKIFSFFVTNFGYSRNQGANLCAEVRPNSVFLRKAENLKIDRNALCIMKK